MLMQFAASGFLLGSVYGLIALGFAVICAAAGGQDVRLTR
jgi:branched-subunit amino acid ABC-type transport system permease component